MAKKPVKIEIINRKASFEYFFVQEYDAGIMLTGTEIKSIRAGNANLSDAWCLLELGELWVKSMFIAEYSHGTDNNHETRRTRKLLLRKPEIRKLENRKITKFFKSQIFLFSNCLSQLESYNYGVVIRRTEWRWCVAVIEFELEVVVNHSGFVSVNMPDGYTSYLAV